MTIKHGNETEKEQNEEIGIYLIDTKDYCTFVSFFFKDNIFTLSERCPENIDKYDRVSAVKHPQLKFC
jgi:hypothetical protein